MGAAYDAAVQAIDNYTGNSTVDLVNLIKTHVGFDNCEAV